MKTIVSLIKVFLIFFVIGSLFFLLINKTFIYEVYKTEEMNSGGIPIKRFMYLNDESEGKATFYTPYNISTLEQTKKSYLEKLESCYGKYYYDKDNNITIINYNINDDKYLRSVSIEYVKDNYCSTNYTLSDMWVYEFNNLSEYLSGDITEKAIIDIIKTIYKSKKQENPIIKDYESKVSLSATCSTDGVKYNLIFQDFGENELLVKKVSGDTIQFAVYEINGIIDYLNGLEKTS